ncbi:type 1 glutamine amidotransferase domain-containing protein [Alteromonas lipotrueiana]|uniref:type 1 glutamine amidotransferase domain-containing protein n=1 Tax=Alteromonas lipotrueiana TaxID=2803815 RepID=UPI001C4402BC|nr:type 1 glutamine amidotransferase domain-containing protein [Alteromonas lipotrueiana]
MGVLTGKTVAILATDGFEQVELTEPMKQVKDAGAEVHIVSLESGQIQGMNHDEKGDKFSVDKTVDEVSADDYNGLILPGGVLNPDTLRTNKKAVQLVRDFFSQHKPVSAICHGPWLLVEADVLKDRTITSFPSIKTDVINAGAKWVDQEVVVDQGLTTSRDPNDLEAFCKKVIEELREGKHEKQTV